MRRPERKEMKGRDRMSKVKNDQEFIYCHGIVVQHMPTHIFWHSLFKKKCCLVAKSYPILLWPCGLKPARLFCSWDFPGKNTGVSEWHCSVLSNSLWPHGLYPTMLLRPWDFQARELEWVVISFSRGSSRPRDWTPASRIVGRHFTVWVTREEYWSGLPFPSLGDLPNPGIEPTSPALAVGFFTIVPSGKPI